MVKQNKSTPASTGVETKSKKIHDTMYISKINDNNVEHFVYLNKGGINDTTNFEKISFDRLIEIINEGECYQPILNDDVKNNEREKKKCWYITANGMRERKNQIRDNLIEQNKWIILDFDLKENPLFVPHFNEFINVLNEDEYVFSFYRTINGGVRIFIILEDLKLFNDVSNLNEDWITTYRNYYNKVKNHFAEKWGVKFDDKCSDISRSFFIFEDKNMVIKKNYKSISIVDINLSQSTNNNININANANANANDKIQQKTITFKVDDNVDVLKDIIIEKEIKRLKENGNEYIESNRNNWVFLLAGKVKRKIMCNYFFNYCLRNDYTIGGNQKDNYFELKNTIRSAYNYQDKQNDKEDKREEKLKRINELTTKIKEEEINIPFNNIVELLKMTNEENSNYKEIIEAIKMMTTQELNNLTNNEVNDITNITKAIEFNSFCFNLFKERTNGTGRKYWDVNKTQFVHGFFDKHVKCVKNSIRGYYIETMGSKFQIDDKQEINNFIVNLELLFDSIYNVQNTYKEIESRLIFYKTNNFIFEDEIRDNVFKEIVNMDIQQAKELYNEFKMIYNERIYNESIDDETFFWRSLEFYLYNVVRHLIDDDFVNEYILTLYSNTHGTGKTEFVNILIKYFKMNNLTCLDSMNDRDTMRNLLTKVFIFDEETCARTKKENSFIKAMTSSKKINFNEKYITKDVEGIRIGNFIACTNISEIIKEHESRRDIILKFDENKPPIEWIEKASKLKDVKYSIAIFKVIYQMVVDDINNTNNNNNQFEFYNKERYYFNVAINENNKEFKTTSFEEEIISSFFEPISYEDSKNYYTVKGVEEHFVRKGKGNKKSEKVMIMGLKEIVDWIQFEKKYPIETKQLNHLLKKMGFVRDKKSKYTFFDENKNEIKKTVNGFLIKLIKE